MTLKLHRSLFHIVWSSFVLILSTSALSQTITHQISLPAGDSWCSDTMINGLFNTINTFRAQNGVPALSMDSVGMKDAEIRATQFAAYMAVNQPNSPGFNPHQGWDTLAASLGYNIVSENLAYMTTDPNYIVNAVWQDTLHLNALLANANITGVSCVFSAGIPYWTYDPGCRSTGCSGGSAPQPPQGPSTTGTPTLDSEEWAFVTLINNFRAQNGAGPLQVSVALSNSSDWMSNDMATKNYFSHTDSLGRSPGSRFAAFNYPYTPWGENIAAGNSDAQSTFNQWVNACDADASGNCTFAHRNNMLYSGFVVMGIARVFNANSQYGWYWTNDFGGVVDQVITPGSGGNPSPKPALGIRKSHSGNFTQGQQRATYNLTVSNGTSAGPTSGAVTVAEAIPSGLTLVSMVGSGWTCQGTQCTRSDALAAGGSYPAITVTVNVSSTASSPQVNSASVSGGGSASASTSDSTVITSASGGTSKPALSIRKSHSGNFTQGQQHATYTLTVSNGTSAGPTSGTVTVAEAIPSGLTLVSMVGSGWTCQGTQCSRSDALAAGASYPAITVTVNVSSTASSPQVNSASVSGGGSASSSASDSTVITTTTISGPPTAVSVTPSSGTGATQQFTFVWSDPKGFSDITGVAGLFNTAINAQGACFFIVDPVHRNFLFADDSGSNWSVLPVGSAGSLQNSQCVLAGTGSTLSGSGNNLTLNVSLTFKPAFAGAKSTFAWVQNAAGSANWQTMGSWTVPTTLGSGNQGSTAPSVTPASGTGATQKFTFVWSDPKGFSDITGVAGLFNTSITAQGACLFIVDPAHRNFLFADDSGSQWSVLPIGSAGSLQNSQCILTGTGSTLSGSGNNLTLNVTLTFKPAFAGGKSTFAWMQNAAGAASWQSLGHWTVP